ncbi:NAD(P)H-hydrate dehydratase [Natronocalculus amylovorans]|uniref:Bifunctional NAD(P)H-hydrate repair enzyme n=1 Tax=Natronocalculus amylovorans TaxID=2917812 RepID=A0AAE3FXH0_9EURY|nr:NAD(P)H-hydrate dehydratase [Natronocalculus amylovorans]MCL9817177.1 NAD(P)H-hydrate dehydratase [Natronocalculus amylovorans]
MIRSDRMAAVDRNAEALGIPRKQLMESSGNAIARVVREHVSPGERVVFVCGRGNNGGDAFVAARFLSEYQTETILLGKPETITTVIAKENWDALRNSESKTQVVRDSSELSSIDLDSADVVVDAMIGTGVSGSLREPEATAAHVINDTDAVTVAIDVPSGIDADTGKAAGIAVNADYVVTFHDTKPGLETLSASVTVHDIGIPDAASVFVGPGDLDAEKRASESHKGDHGTVAVIGGGPYTGAPTLTARAALRSGTDLVRVVVPEVIAREVQGFSENLIVRSYAGDRLTPEQLESVMPIAADNDVVVLGPGLGDHPETIEAVGQFLQSYDGKAVIDADALSVVPDVDTNATLICTPHQGELKKMGGKTDIAWRERKALVESFAGQIEQTVLVKGAYDIVTDGKETRVNRTGNPGMTVGGTGDVLAGVTGSLFATSPPLTAASVGAYLTGTAGDIAFEQSGNGLMATDLIDLLPEARRTHE